jgi:hypothetical protein
MKVVRKERAELGFGNWVKCFPRLWQSWRAVSLITILMVGGEAGSVAQWYISCLQWSRPWVWSHHHPLNKNLPWGHDIRQSIHLNSHNKHSVVNMLIAALQLRKRGSYLLSFSSLFLVFLSTSLWERFVLLSSWDEQRTVHETSFPQRFNCQRRVSKDL